MNSLIRIAIANDYPLFLHSLAAWMNTEPGIAVCGTFEDTGEMVRWYNGSNADLLLLDYPVSDVIGNKAIETLIEDYPEAKIVILSVDEKTADIHKLNSLGIRAWFKKDARPEAILKLFNSLCLPVSFKDPKESAQGIVRSKEKLSKREVEIIKHITQGKTTLQIGCELNLSPLTIKTHRQNLLKKLNVSNTPQLLEKARYQGYLK